MSLNAVIGALRVNLGMDSAKYEEGLKRARHQTRQSAQSISSALKPLAAVIAGAFSIHALKGQMEFLDSQAKMARSIDGTVNGLQALQLAGTDAGVSFDQIGTSMQQLDRYLGQMGIVGGTSAKALADIGLKASDLMKMDSDQRLAAIADQVKKLGLNASQTAGILGLLGVRNKEMTLLVMQGGDAIRNARKEVSDLGLSLSKLDMHKVESANDAMKRIGLVFEGIANKFVVAVAPTLKALADGFVAAAKPAGILGSVVKIVTDNIGQFLSIAMAASAFMAGRMILSFTGLGSAIAGVTLSMEGLKAALITSGIGALIVVIGEAIYAFGRLSEGAGGFGKAMALLANVAQESWTKVKQWMAYAMKYAKAEFIDFKGWATEAFNFVGRKAAEWAHGFATAMAHVAAWMDPNKTFADFAKKIPSVDSVYKPSEGAAKESAAAWKAANDALHQAKAPMTSLKPLTDAWKKSVADAADALKGTADAAHGLDTALTTAGANGKHALNEAEQAAQSFTGQLKSDFQGLISGAESFNQVLSNVLGSLANMFASKAFNALSGGKGGWMDTAVNALFGVGHNANGTPNWRGGLTTINERGDEMAVLPSGSAVLTHAQSQQLLRGQGGNHVHVTVGVDNNGNLRAFVERTAGHISASISEAQLAHYDSNILPTSFHRIAQNPDIVG